MRTVIFFGVAILADCINYEKSVEITEKSPLLLIGLLLIAIIGDLVSFSKKIKKLL